MVGVAVMVRDKYAVGLAPEQRKSSSDWSGWAKTQPE